MCGSTGQAASAGERAGRGRLIRRTRWLVVWAGVASCTQPAPESPPDRGDRVEAPDQEAWDVTKRVTRNGKLRATISSPHLQKYDRERVSRLDGGVTVSFFSPRSGRILSTLTSAKASIYEERRIITATDSVILVSSSGSTLYTDTLRWEEETERIQGPSTVRIEGAHGIETGIGFNATSDLSSWTLNQVVTRIDTSIQRADDTP